MTKMDPTTLIDNYDKLNESDFKHLEETWRFWYDETEQKCSHFGNCKLGAMCTIGKRTEKRHAFCGSVFEVWQDLELMCPSDTGNRRKGINVLRVNTLTEEGEDNGRLIGLEIPENDIENVCTRLSDKMKGEEPYVSSLCDRDEYTEVCSKLYEELEEHVRKVTNSSSQGEGKYANIDKGDEQDHDNYSNPDPDKTDDEEEDQMDIRLHVAEPNQSQATSPNTLRPRRKCRTATPMNYNEDAYDVEFSKQLRDFNSSSSKKIKKSVRKKPKLEYKTTKPEKSLMDIDSINNDKNDDDDDDDFEDDQKLVHTFNNDDDDDDFI